MTICESCKKEFAPTKNWQKYCKKPECRRYATKIRQQKFRNSPKDRGVRRLYVWTGFCPDYSDGLAFAIADSLEEAKEHVKKTRLVNRPWDDGLDSWGELHVHGLREKVCYFVDGGQ